MTQPFMTQQSCANTLSSEQMQKIAAYDLEQRLNYVLKTAVTEQSLWILSDEHGCVMLNSEDEDCVPLWPHKEFAEQFATGEWQDCKAQAISLKKWQSHWTPGLEEDELALAVFPSLEDEGQILYPDEFDHLLKQKIKKLSK